MNVDARSELASFFAHMRESHEKCTFTDVLVVCNDKVAFPCHRLILAAASDYFDEKLFENVDGSLCVRRVDLHPSITSGTFELVLKYIYSGMVRFLNDANVYDLLIASDVLRLKTVREACHHYLSQKGVPEESAVQLFSYAFSKNDPSLQSTVSRFLLRNMNDIPTLGSVSPSKFNVLLSYFRANSRIEEKSMLQKILKWTLLSPPETPSREEVKLNFMNSLNKYNFEYLSQKYAEEYFEKMVAANDCPVHLRTGVSWKSARYRRSALAMVSQSPLNTLKLYTLHKKGDMWKQRTLDPRIGEGVLCRMRCTVVGYRHHLYWLLSNASNERDGRKIQIEFCTSPSVYSFPHSIVLPSPFSDVPPTHSVHVCSDKNSTIFACASNSSTLRLYNCELQQWSEMSLGNDFFPRTMTWYDRQLYLFGGASPTSTRNVLRSIDLRNLRSCHVWGLEHMYAARYECTSHNGRLYLASFHDYPSGMMIFDPIAEKAIDIKMPQTTFDVECRLTTFQDNLYTVNCDSNRSIRVDIFDPYSQTFENVPVDGVVDPGSYLFDVVVYKQN